MESAIITRLALSMTAAALLAACGGSQPPIGEPGAMPQSREIVSHAARGGSWMLPEAKKINKLFFLLAKLRSETP